YYIKAFQFFQRAAALGDAEACFLLGQLCANYWDLPEVYQLETYAMVSGKLLKNTAELPKDYAKVLYAKALQYYAQAHHFGFSNALDAISLLQKKHSSQKAAAAAHVSNEKTST